MRRIEVRTTALDDPGVDLVAVPVPEGGDPVAAIAAVDERCADALRRLLERGAFRGKEGESLLLPRAEGPELLAVGLGDSGATAEGFRRAAGVAIRSARRARARSVVFVMPAAGNGETSDAMWQAAAEGLVLGDWAYDELRGADARRERPPPPDLAVLVPGRDTSSETGPGPSARAAAEHGRLIAEAQNAARELVTQPGNVVTPAGLAAVARELAEKQGLDCRVWGPSELREAGFGALLAVARGSMEKPRFIHIEHTGEGGAPWCVVGKGVTFDSGGISLKPASGMEEMKSDMAGAAAVLGILQAAAGLALPQRVVGLIPATENLPSGSALKPADVIRGVSGRSIEVVNTDAEGRLILSDALSFACRLDPKAIVDLATLTGGCVVALGHHAIGLMSPDDALAEELERAGRRTGERVWRLPLWEAYRKQLDSEIADIKNSGGREASPITAGRFLQEFVDDGVRWAHLDIAGTAWAEEERPYQPKGATGVGVRLLVEWLRHTG